MGNTKIVGVSDSSRIASGSINGGIIEYCMKKYML